MKPPLLLAALLLTAPAFAADAPSPGEIVAAAPAGEWVKIAPEDLLVMDLAPDRDGKARRVVIELMPPPFSQAWVGNIRTLAKAHWWDGLAIVRSQDDYVVQWGDPDSDDPSRAKPLPPLFATAQGDYTVPLDDSLRASWQERALADLKASMTAESAGQPAESRIKRDSYALTTQFVNGWPVASDLRTSYWPVHCYGMVGAGRGMAPDAGSGAELYTVIGHAPRHLDRNIALVGRVIEGIEHLSTLPRGTEALGFYETPGERTPIVSVRLGNDVPGLPLYEYLSTDSETFARYADARANRRDPFFIVPAGGVDVCNVPVPVRRVPAAQ
jgi:cyclophilin family peptidyl-prolyl cis-trans isomerase